MDWAASNGHLEVVKWLHYNRTEGCSQNTLDKALLRSPPYEQNTNFYL